MKEDFNSFFERTSNSTNPKVNNDGSCNGSTNEIIIIFIIFCVIIGIIYYLI